MLHAPQHRDTLQGFHLVVLDAGDRVSAEFTFDATMSPGTYFFTLSAGTGEGPGSGACAF